MQAKNTPHYRGPCFHWDAKSPITPTNDNTPSNAQVQLSLFMAVTSTSSVILPLSNFPVRFGTFDDPVHSQTNPTIKYISKFPALAVCVTHFTQVIYSFNSGHFSLSIRSRNLPFVVTLACNPFGYACTLLSEFTGCHCILPSALASLDHLGNNSIVNGYLIHFHQFQMSKPTSTFWSLQLLIVTQLHRLHSFSVFVAFVHPDHDEHSVSKFVTTLTNMGWIITTVHYYFPDVGNSITGYTSVILGVHNLT
jgi:hypothetical protein